jgi:hypothetical protein
MSRGPVGFWIITTVGADGRRTIGYLDGGIGHVEVLKTILSSSRRSRFAGFAASPSFRRSSIKRMILQSAFLGSPGFAFSSLPVHLNLTSVPRSTRFFDFLF